jgi:hypothetical protein
MCKIKYGGGGFSDFVLVRKSTAEKPGFSLLSINERSESELAMHKISER